MAGSAGGALNSGAYLWSSGDMRNLANAIKRSGFTPDQVERIWRDCHAQLIGHWHYVRKVAYALLDKKELSRNDIKQLLK